MSAIRPVASLIIALSIVQLAQGVLSVHLPLTMAADAISRTGVGFAGAAYSAGFMAGAYLGPTYLARIGHIRIFAAATAVVAATVLAAFWAGGVLAWMVNRFATGAGVALAFAAGEAWMNGAVRAGERGHVIGFYQVCTKGALAAGPFLAVSAAPGAAQPLMIAAMLMALAMLPVCFTSRAQPEAPHAQPMGPGELFAIAPAAVIACFAAGLINSGITTLAPLYAQARFGAGAAARFQAAAWIGALILQWPAGRISDRIDRRLVIAALLLLAMAAALTLAIVGAELPLPAASLIFALWGAGGLTYYGIGVAHMADRASAAQIARASAGLLFVWAVGSVAGPLIMGVAFDIAGPDALFWGAAGASALVAFAMLWRRGSRPETPAPDKTAFANPPATSVAAGELAYGEGKGPLGDKGGVAR